MDSYFNDNVIIKDPKTQDDIDFVHWAATLNVYIYSTSWSDGSDLKHQFADQFVQEAHIDNLSGWAGDLQTLVKDVKRDTSNSDNYNTLYSSAINLMGTSNPSVQSSFPIGDVLADVDASNIYNKLGTSKSDLASAFRSYYSGGYNTRYKDFTGGMTKEAIRSLAGTYTDS